MLRAGQTRVLYSLTMTVDALTEDWALWAAAIPAVIVVVAVAWMLARKSRGGQLRRVLRDHKFAARDLRNAARATRKADGLVRKLAAKAQDVKPRVLEEAREALQDARALEKIAADKVQIAANHVRRVIHDEFPPSRHDKLRARHLPDDVRDNRPFTF